MRPTEVMFDADVRTENLMWLPGVFIDEGSCPDVFVDEFADDLPEAGHPLYQQFPALGSYVETRPDAEPEDLAEFLRFHSGFLVQAATPARRYTSPDTFLSGWGSYYTAWLYAKTEADIAPVCAAWAEAMHAKDAAKLEAA